MPATSSSKSSSDSSSITLVDPGSVEEAPSCQKKADASQQVSGAEPGKSATEKPASAKPMPEKSGPAKAAAVQPAPERATSSKPAAGWLDGFLHAPWGWGTFPVLDPVTVEAARDFQQRQKEKKGEN